VSQAEGESPLVVVDSSLVLKAVLPNPDLERCQAVLALIEERQLLAPALWIYEIVSALTKAVHFGSLTPAEGKAALHQSLALGVQVILPDETQAALAYEGTLALKRAAAYDSFYLVVAEALNADFWTADRRLAGALAASRPSWLHTIDEIE
jgi:predicted nucleic acid-binding protein